MFLKRLKTDQFSRDAEVSSFEAKDDKLFGMICDPVGELMGKFFSQQQV